MLKKYKANSQISINVRRNGTRLHLSFAAMTGGGSVFYTENEAMQEALEKHPMFGKLFTLDKVVVPVEEVEPIEEEKPSKERVEVTCTDDAKEWLVERFGVSRTKLRSIKAIKDMAEQNNIEFIGID